MSPSFKASGRQRNVVPREFIVRWQSSTAGRKRTLARRPRTACVPCRLARVKCNGQQECERCIHRNIACRYSASAAVPGNAEPSETSYQTLLSATSRKTPRTVSPGATARSASKSATLEPTFLSNSNMHSPSRVMQLDDAVDDDQNMPFLIPPDSSFPCASPTDGSQCAFSLPRLLADTDPMEQAEFFTPATSVYTEVPSIEAQMPPHMTGRCCWRSRLLTLSYEVRGGKPDELFRVAGDILACSQSIVNCSKCETSCADLICITAVLQQMSSCWEMLVNDQLLNTVKVSVGGHEVLVADSSGLKRALVIDLVTQTKSLLGSVKCIAEQPSILASKAHSPDQLNSAYLQGMIAFLENTCDSVAIAS